MLLVLPGPEHHSTMKLDWAAVTDSVERLHFLYNFEAFQAIWHGYYRYHRCVLSYCAGGAGVANGVTTGCVASCTCSDAINTSCIIVTSLLSLPTFYVCCLPLPQVAPAAWRQISSSCSPAQTRRARVTRRAPHAQRV